MLISLMFAPEPAVRQGPAPVELEWRAPEGCPDAEQVMARAAIVLGRPVSSPPGEQLRVTGTVEATHAGLSSSFAPRWRRG